MKLKFEANSDYCYLFDYNAGKSITIEKRAFFMRENGPNLLDVSITNRCNRCCNFCYRQSKEFGEDITLEEYSIILNNAKECGVQQIALGGGEPTLHPHFCDILKMTRENGIIPNFSTNGDSITRDILMYAKEYCGAIAVSIYNNISTYEELIRTLSENNIPINLHFVLRSDKIEEYIRFLEEPPEWLSKIQALIFLNYKPVNGMEYLCLKFCNQELLKTFFERVALFKICGIGFDTCSVSFICTHLEIDNSLYDYCEAGRKSAYINEKLEVYPCSFYSKGTASLKKEKLKTIWQQSDLFNEHRHILNISKPTCAFWENCHSGCSLFPINACADCESY